MQILNNKIDLINFLCERQSMNDTVLKLQVESVNCKKFHYYRTYAL